MRPQLGLLTEAVRVAPSWNVDLWYRNRHWLTGVGLRAWAKGLVVRIDLTGSDEEVGVQMLVGQRFQF